MSDELLPLIQNVNDNIKDLKQDVRELRSEVKENVRSLTKVRVNLGKLSLLATLGGFFGGAVLDTAKDTIPFIHKQEKIKVEQTKPTEGE